MRTVTSCQFIDLLEKIEEIMPMDSVAPSYVATFVHKAIDYAKSLGFDPQGDYQVVKEFLEGIPLDLSLVFIFGENGEPVYTAMAITGTSAWPTPVGEFVIGRRVANETMSSDTIGIPRNSPGGYHLTNVLYTQYFTGSGHSIHYNYWSSNFGYSGSHGCLGMDLEDSKFFWDWAGPGTPVSIHY